jgi:hypothetical protein
LHSIGYHSVAEQMGVFPMQWKSRGFFILGGLMFLASGVMFVVAVSGAWNLAPGSDAKVQQISLLNVLLGVGFMVTSGLLCVAGAVLAVAERLPKAKDCAEQSAVADRPRE